VLEARDIVIAVGSVAKVPKLEGLEEAGYWTNKEGTSLRTLPKSIVILGAGPSGTELAQVYAGSGAHDARESPAGEPDRPSAELRAPREDAPRRRS